MRFSIIGTNFYYASVEYINKETKERGTICSDSCFTSYKEAEKFLSKMKPNILSIFPEYYITKGEVKKTFINQPQT